MAAPAFFCLALLLAASLLYAENRVEDAVRHNGLSLVTSSHLYGSPDLTLDNAPVAGEVWFMHGVQYRSDRHFLQLVQSQRDQRGQLLLGDDSPESRYSQSLLSQSGGVELTARHRYQDLQLSYALHGNRLLQGGISFGGATASLGYSLSRVRRPAHMRLAFDTRSLVMPLAGEMLLHHGTAVMNRYELSVLAARLSVESRETDYRLQVNGRVAGLKAGYTSNAVRGSVYGLLAAAAGGVQLNQTSYGRLDTFRGGVFGASGNYAVTDAVELQLMFDAASGSLGGNNYISSVPFFSGGGWYPLRWRNILWSGWAVAPGAGLRWRGTIPVTNTNHGRTLGWNVGAQLRYGEARSLLSYQQKRFTWYPLYTYDTVEEPVRRWAYLLGSIEIELEYHGPVFHVVGGIRQWLPLADLSSAEESHSGGSTAIGSATSDQWLGTTDFMDMLRTLKGVGLWISLRLDM